MNSQPSVDTAPLPAQRIEFATWCRMTVQEFEKARGYTVKVSQAFNRMYAEGFSPCRWPRASCGGCRSGCDGHGCWLEVIQSTVGSNQSTDISDWITSSTR